MRCVHRFSEESGALKFKEIRRLFRVPTHGRVRLRDCYEGAAGTRTHWHLNRSYYEAESRSARAAGEKA